MVKTVKSDQDLKIYENDKFIKIFAGPGAGKTHLLIENIKKIIENSEKIRNSGRKILCITYTNVAANEILLRLGSYAEYVYVSTIHSFLSKYVIEPYQQQLKLLIKKEFNIEISKNLKITSRQEGFSLLSGIKKEDIFAFIDKKYISVSKDKYENLSKIKMSKTILDISSINIYNTNESKVSIKNKSVDEEVVIAIKDFIWSKAGRLDFDEILYWGLRLIEKYEFITYILQIEFPYIFLDEYQDTNPIQNKIIKKIAEKENSIIIIGDIAQSIYSFQGATYKEFQSFSIESKIESNEFVINGNRRSTINIIKFLNYLRKNDDKLNEQTCAKNYNENDKITFFVQKTKNKIILSDYIKEDYKVISRKWSEAFNYIENISDEQKKLLNNIQSTYTYILNKELGREMELKRDLWIQSTNILKKLEDSYRKKCLPSFLEILEKDFKIKKILNSYDKKKHLLLKKFIDFWEKNFSNINDKILLKDFIIQVNNSLLNIEREKITILKYPLEEDDEYYEKLYKDIDKLEYKTARKLWEEIFSENPKYMTIHGAKGTEHKVVVLNIEPFSRDEKNIDPIEVLKNPEILDSKYGEIYEEYTRIIYVGASRAENKLYLHLYDKNNLSEELQNSLDEYFGIDEEKDRFYEFIYV